MPFQIQEPKVYRKSLAFGYIGDKRAFIYFWSKVPHTGHDGFLESSSS